MDARSSRHLIWREGKLQSFPHTDGISFKTRHHETSQLPSKQQRSSGHHVSYEGMQPNVFGLNPTINQFHSRYSTLVVDSNRAVGRRRGAPRGRRRIRPFVGQRSVESTHHSTMSSLTAETHHVRSSVPRAGSIGTVSKNYPPMLLPLRDDHPPTNMSCHPLDATAMFDPLAALEHATVRPPGGGSSVFGASDSSGLAGALAMNSRIKSSTAGIGDVDLESLRSYRRLNGYTLFVMVNRKQHASVTTANDDATGTGSENGPGGAGSESQRVANKKWQAIWSTLPEKSRKEWRTKARRLLKQLHQSSKRFLDDGGGDNDDKRSSHERRMRELSRLEQRIERNQSGVTCELIDLAAHFQLLSEAFESSMRELNEHEGPVLPESVDSMLLDALLTGLISLTALTSEVEILSDVPDRADVCRGLRNLTYITPI